MFFLYNALWDVVATADQKMRLRFFHASVLLLIMNVDARGDSRVDPQTTMTIFVWLHQRLVSFTFKNTVYYINTSEIPSELSRENFISSHVKIICYLHT